MNTKNYNASGEIFVVIMYPLLSQVNKPKKARTESKFELVCLGSPSQACVDNSPVSDPVPSSSPPLCDPVSGFLFLCNNL